MSKMEVSVIPADAQAIIGKKIKSFEIVDTTTYTTAPTIWEMERGAKSKTYQVPTSIKITTEDGDELNIYLGCHSYGSDFDETHYVDYDVTEAKDVY